METLLIMMLLPLPIIVEQAQDPSPGIFTSKQDARNLECVRMSQEQAHAEFPVEIPDLPARRTSQVNGAVICSRRIMRHGERNARDERILSSLRATVAEITESATATAGSDLNWHVDAYYPDARVAQKISVAARTQLAESGRRVSDRVPLLAAGDLAVLGRLAPQDSYRIACARYFAEGSLEPGDAFLGLMIVDPRESQLHAGVCLDGQWRWLR